MSLADSPAGRAAWAAAWALAVAALACASPSRAGDGPAKADAARPVPGREPAAKPAGLPRLMLLEPGAVVGPGPPKGYSHLAMKSVPRLASGDLGTLPSSAAATATLFRTAIAADVRRAEAGYTLARVGIGLCVPSRRGDVVVDVGHVGALDGPLGFMEAMVLEAAEAELKRGRLALRTPTFALFLAPATQVVAGRHAAVHLYYAFRVDPRTGRLLAAAWSMDAGPGPAAAPRELVELPPAAAVDCALDVEANRVLGAIPVSWSFAMKAMPPGRRVPVGPALGALMARAAQGQDVSSELERGLVGAIGGDGPSAASPPARR